MAEMVREIGKANFRSIRYKMGSIPTVHANPVHFSFGSLTSDQDDLM